MSFKDLDIQLGYESGKDNIVQDFYQPLLSSSYRYDRIAGFFSSASLAIVARGMYDFIKNHGHMRLITSPILSASDGKVINDISTCTIEDLNISLDDITDSFMVDHIKAFGWMLKEEILDIRFAVPVDGSLLATDGLFHQKVGIFEDNEGNVVSFSGSINETAYAWLNNIEEFKVFKSWTASQEYCLRDRKNFEEIWSGKRDNIWLFDIPKAVKEKLIKYSSDFDIERISYDKYPRRNTLRKALMKPIPLFPYQGKAKEKWLKNDCSLLFEMATGTGKTRTAIACMQALMSKLNSLMVIISTPQNTLSKQWRDSVHELGIKVDREELIDCTVPKWRENILRTILNEQKNNVISYSIIYTVHHSASSDKFVSAIQKYGSDKINYLFIGDEVHWLGAGRLRRALLANYTYRIGLSATPSRWFDDEGTTYLSHYFGNGKFEFTLHDALTVTNPITLKTFLTPYEYHIHEVTLDDIESRQFVRLSQSLRKLRLGELSEEKETKIQRLLEKRANVIKNAEAKYKALSMLLDRMIVSRELEDVIIFVSPQQIDKVLQILQTKHIIYSKITEKEGTTPSLEYGGLSQRESIIKHFRQKDYKVLVAMKCLDEGIDIPTASRGIILSSSTNPREYVQRVGRIIRRDNNKAKAFIYDFCVLTTPLDSDEQEYEKKIREKEIARIREIAYNSLNPVDSEIIINKLT